MNNAIVQIKNLKNNRLDYLWFFFTTEMVSLWLIALFVLFLLGKENSRCILQRKYRISVKRQEA